MPQLLDGVLRPLGLVTQPNKFGYYEPGALKTASGIYIRDPAVLTTQQVFSSQFTVPWAGSPTAFLLIPIDKYSQYTRLILYRDITAVWRYSFDATDVGAITFSLGTGPNSNWVTSAEVLCSGTGYRRIGQYTINGFRLVIPMLTGTTFFDFVAPPFSTNPTPRVGGIAAPFLVGALSSTTAQNNVLANNKHVHYTAVIRRVFDDGVELVSAPAPAIEMANTSGSTRAVSISVKGPATVLSTDYVDIYRTRAQSLTVNTGADYYLCASVSPPNSFASGGSTVTVFDVTNDENLGEALYTNSGVRGAAAANHMPPLCKNAFTFKGHTFYLGVTDLPSITLRVGAGMFNTVDSSAGLLSYRAGGIGRRFVIGNCTSGGNQISAVSATDMIGIVVGQSLTNSAGGLSAAMHVSAVGASTITFSGGTFTANSTGGSFATCDTMEVDGIETELFSLDTWLGNMSAVGMKSTTSVDLLDRVLPPAALTTFSSLNGTVPAESFTIYRPYSVNAPICLGNLTIRATNGNNYTPSIPRIEAAEAARQIPPRIRPNIFRWSEQNNADASPKANYAACGSGSLYMGYSMRDCGLMFASDGCFRLSGTGGQAGAGYDWRLDPIDSTLILSGPRCGCVARDTFYGYTNRGFVSVDSSGGVKEISQGRVQDLMPGPAWSETQAAFVFFDETNDEIIIKTELSTTLYVYNLLTDSFTTIVTPVTAFDGAYIRGLGRISVVAAGGVYEQSGAFSGVAASVDYQPTYGENPFAMQEWQSMDLVFDAANAGVSVTPRFNEAVGGTARTLAVRGKDQARSSFGVGRNTPKKATCISPGWSVAGGLAQLRFFGVGLRKVPISIQKEQR